MKPFFPPSPFPFASQSEFFTIFPCWVNLWVRALSLASQTKTKTNDAQGTTVEGVVELMLQCRPCGWMELLLGRVAPLQHGE